MASLTLTLSPEDGGEGNSGETRVSPDGLTSGLEDGISLNLLTSRGRWGFGCLPSPLRRFLRIDGARGRC